MQVRVTRVSKAIGCFKHGAPDGPHWIRKPGNAFLICPIDAAGEIADCDGAVYLYPSLELAIVADFRDMPRSFCRLEFYESTTVQIAYGAT